MSKNEFITFVKGHPELITKVNNNSTTWQKLYDIYTIYGENNDIWDRYIINNTVSTTSGITALDLLSLIKNIDLDSVQRGVTNLQKTISMIQDLGVGSRKEIKEEIYEPRPMYKYFDD